MNNTEYKASKTFLIIAVITFAFFLLLFAFTTSKYIVAINESIITNEMCRDYSDKVNTISNLGAQYTLSK